MTARIYHNGPPDFEQMVRDNSARIYNMMFQMSGNAQDTEDLVQEVFFQAYKSLPGFRGKSSVSTWLYRIAMNVACDALRRKQRRPQLAGDVSYEEREAMGGIEPRAGSAEDLFLQKESMAQAREAILKIPVKYRAPLVLNVVEGYAHGEIAQILGISEGTARVRLFRALKMLRKEMGRTG